MPVSRARFLDRMAVLFEEDGLSPTSGRIFGRLLLSAEPLSLDELAADIGVSKAGASTETRVLERRGVIERVSRPGSRRVYHQVVDALPVRTMELRLERLRRFRALVREAPRGAGRRGAPVRRRLAEVDAAYGRLLGAIGAALDGWHAGR